MSLDGGRSTLRVPDCHEPPTPLRHRYQFCRDYARRTEFRRLCEMLRQHLGNLQKAAAHGQTNRLRGWDGWTPESVEMHLQASFASFFFIFICRRVRQRAAPTPPRPLPHTTTLPRRIVRSPREARAPARRAIGRRGVSRRAGAAAGCVGARGRGSSAASWAGYDAKTLTEDRDLAFGPG